MVRGRKACARARSLCARVHHSVRGMGPDLLAIATTPSTRQGDQGSGVVDVRLRFATLSSHVVLKDAPDAVESIVDGCVNILVLVVRPRNARHHQVRAGYVQFDPYAEVATVLSVVRRGFDCNAA